ncbi:MAG: hypothetical protein ABJA67_09300 [Chthonomonadales bacterium]
MTFDPSKHRRQSIRLKDFDYSQPGGYFVTMVAQNRREIFGEIVDSEMRLNAAGQMLERWWKKLSEKYANLHMLEFVVMPNHFHGIIMIVDEDHVGADPRTLSQKSSG